MGLTEAVQSDDRRVALVALRDRLARDLEDGGPRYAASLARQLRDVLAEIDSLKVPEVSKLDDLAAKRAARRTPKVPKRAAGKQLGGAGSG